MMVVLVANKYIYQLIIKSYEKFRVNIYYILF